ncbi:MAG: hypothetical protein LBC49_01740, partial [Bacteroidales bacterium]|nr:hypothetical protein [Bacteroidales bacterium]
MKRILLSLFVVCAGLCSLNAANYFVKINGGGDGSSWNDAFSPAAAKTAIETAATGDTFFFAAGTYKFGSALTITSGIVVQGGYSMDAQGIETVIIYPSENITVFSGNNSHQVLLINSPSNKVTLKGVTVAEGKITSGSAAADSRPGVHVRPTSMLELYYCTITANQNTVVASAAAGGAGIYIETNNTNGGQVYAYKSVISNNISNNRGGGIRLGGNNVKLILEQCLVTGNSTDGGSSGNYGGGIQGSGTGTWMCLINTTVTGNSLSGKGGGGVATDGSLFLISSTIAGNITGDASEGTDLRLGNASSVFHSINSIVVGGESNAICVTPVNAMSNGFNILGSILSRSGGSLIAAQTDITNKTATQIFNTSSLNDNDGYPQTLKPVTLVAGATLAELEAFKTNFNLNIGDVSKDQRGNSRATEGRVCRGAYDDGTSFKDTVIIPDNIKYPLTQDTFIVWGNGYGENKLLRFPQKWQSIIPTENNIWQRVQYSAGMQIRFHTNASTLIVNCANSKYASNDWF